MNVKKLKSKMVLCGDENFVLATASILGVSRQTASSKLNGESEFTLTEVAKISRHYGLTERELYEIFIKGDSKDDSERSGKAAG